MVVSDLKGERLIHRTLDGRRVARRKRLPQRRYGRIREMSEGADGAIRFLTPNRDGRGAPAGNDDRVLRLPRERSERMNGEPEIIPAPPDYPVPQPEPPVPTPPDYPVPRPGELPDYPVPEPEEPLPKPDEPWFSI